MILSKGRYLLLSMSFERIPYEMEIPMYMMNVKEIHSLLISKCFF